MKTQTKADKARVQAAPAELCFPEKGLSLGAQTGADGHQRPRWVPGLQHRQCPQSQISAPAAIAESGAAQSRGAPALRGTDSFCLGPSWSSAWSPTWAQPLTAPSRSSACCSPLSGEAAREPKPSSLLLYREFTFVQQRFITLRCLGRLGGLVGWASNS